MNGLLGFLAPAAFALALLLPVIIAMYLLKLRRTERPVSSTYLWRRAVRDVEANNPWQRLRKNLLLLLQLLFLIALIFALARPFTPTETGGGSAAIFILDTSASMAATDVGPSRLEAAKDQARQLVDELADGARATVIAAGHGAQVLTASTQDRRTAHQAIERVQQGTGNADLGLALELASAIAARQPDTEIVVLSDGRADLPERLSLKGRLRYLPIGISGENLAISLLTLEPAPGGGLTAFAQVTNYGQETAQRRLALYADGQLVNAYDLSVPPAGQQAVLAEGLPATAQAVEARLEGSDALALDDYAVAVRRSSEATPITLATQGNLFLQTALGLLPDVTVTPVDPDSAAELPPAGLTILDSWVPTGTLPSGNLLFISPPRSTEFFTVTGQVNSPEPRVVNPSDPLAAHIQLEGVSILDAARVPLPDWARPIIAGDITVGPQAGGSTPLLFAGERDGRRVAVLTFDLHRSDLPLNMAFPILWANLVGWLAPGAGGLPAQIAPGETLTFNLPPDAPQATVTLPDGSPMRIEAEGGRAVFADTQQLGVYTLQWQGEGESAGQLRFAVNLFSPQESNLEPLGNLALGGQAGEQAGALAEGEGRREWWRPLALVALALLMAEWLVYHRSALSRLAHSLRRPPPRRA